ncbi:type II toxin-antitoxin system VapC family toxin [Plectonema cf. radiosum LEGE 06105]|uniref:Type II toxin-antitoxin system VapC family toxin n=1 Tax=Plectonema cf. radiosum LEGE 06105 TaxID=945769 RepID=A0A8J7F7F5_9CYAN|nr:type II toxin-antitoxin system VapC family toxin [Plectonema radiosum]MBE9213414.1 type II toxin-antitoxin system VapC family toxin [Plectonema cf. radiosum LEGE 06105]
MKLLLDTHTFMWWNSSPNQIPEQTLSLLTQTNNQIFVSLVSVWEIQIKTHLGKLDLQASLSEIILRQQAENGVSLLSILLTHILELDSLPWYHKDPFDRLLIAQSRCENAVLVSRDHVFKAYDCQTIW